VDNCGGDGQARHSAGPTLSSEIVNFDPRSDYPLGQRRPDLVSTPSGLALDEVTLETLREGRLEWGDLRATPETLDRQSAVARASGREELAGSLARAAELAAIPAETILEIYTALRPHRSSAGELEAWAARLDELGAPLAAAFVRQAKDVYVKRGLLAREPAQV
jgi:propanediol dehydratase small subunit